MMSATAWSRSASGSTMRVVLGPAHGLHALSVRRAGRIDVSGDIRRADKADRPDVGMGEDGVDGGLVAVHHVQDAGRPAGLDEQLAQPHRHARVLLRGLEDEAVADRDGDAEHPHRDHGREIERGDAGDDAQRLAHGIDVDAGPGALGVFALERMRDAAGELDHLEPALDVAAGVGQHLAVLAGEQRGELVHARLDQALELEHHPRAALGVDRRPGGLAPPRRPGRPRPASAGVGEGDMRLHLAGVGVENLAGAPEAPASAAPLTK